jgi:O-antigen ligase
VAAAASALAARYLLPLAALLVLAIPLAALPVRLAATCVVVAIAVPAVLVYVPAGFVLLTLAVPFGDPFTLTVGELRVGVASSTVALVLIAWWGQVMVGRRGVVAVPPLLPALLPLVIVILFALPQVRAFMPGLRDLFRWLELGAMYVVASHLLRGRAALLVVGSLLLVGGVEALIGWYQFFTRFGPSGFAIGPFLRAYGTFGQPNPFAGYLITIIPLAFGIVLAVWRFRDAVDRRIALLALLALALGGPALVMSMSRGAWLGLVVGMLAMLLAAGQIGRRALAAGGFLALAVVFAGSLDLLPPTLMARLVTAVESFGIFDARTVLVTHDNFAIVDRMAHWQAAWEMYRAYPLLGVGPGQYPTYYPEFRLPLWPDPKVHAHNFYLQTLAELGIVGALALLIFVLATGWHTVCAVRRTSGLAWGYALGVLGVVAAVGVHSFFDDVLVHGVHAQLGMLLGLATAVQWEPGDGAHRD